MLNKNTSGISGEQLRGLALKTALALNSLAYRLRVIDLMKQQFGIKWDANLTSIHRELCWYRIVTDRIAVKKQPIAQPSSP